MSDYGKRAYWRWKKNGGAWSEAWVKPIGNGLVEVKSLNSWSSPSVLSEDEIEIKWAGQAPEGKG